MTDNAAAPICLARPLSGPGTDRAGGCAAARGGDGRPLHAAALKFFWGPMDCGKSTMALQMNYNHARQGRRGLVTTRIDRSLGPQVTTRIGLAHAAIEVTDELDLRDLVRDALADGIRVDYLICDEASFYNLEHVEQMAELVDEYDVDVYAFGLATDFRSCLFPAAQRLFELADEVARIQIEVLCWCGREGLLNARVVHGRVVREGEQVVIGDTVDDADVRYQVLCRRHYRSGDLGPR
ncbi:thymidine kinase [Micromonospora sp. CB01531]|uniref:thymidine kinase n=1 Tax=Micromonospora sp. CB01531 TaxID=1718947 RepID=UPI0009397451|nr:thymidine kinase [Micromonospora sp. CB01531]OKI85134.1 thymidine kinase [Micromonospora sp. CB01531]